MAEYMFGVSVRDGRTSGRERDRNAEIAQRHGCTWTEIYDQGTGRWKSWFSGPNRGRPFDQQMENRVLADLLEVANGQTQE